MSHSKSSKIAKDELTTEQHQRVMKLGLDYNKADTKTKIVFIRDQLAIEFGDHILNMRLHPREVGVHPLNRETGDITASGVWLRGARVIESGFSYAAIGAPYAFEDHPKRRHIAKHTMDLTKGAEFGTFDEKAIKVGSANWTHCNQFVYTYT